MTVTVRIEGLSELRDTLRELPKSTAKNVLRRVLKKRAQPFAASAQSAVPIEEGELKESIVVSTRLSPRQKRLNRAKAHKDVVEVYVGPGPIKHAHLQEFGTEHHAAQPFLRPAWDKHKLAAIEGIAEDLGTEIMKSIRRKIRRDQRAAAKKAAGG